MQAAKEMPVEATISSHLRIIKPSRECHRVLSPDGTAPRAEKRGEAEDDAGNRRRRITL
ncbi:MAG: hypothetical protein ABSA46_13565 [Thermodesulfovibrionales bacterium]|jgi:hypothetical protein